MLHQGEVEKLLFQAKDLKRGLSLGVLYSNFLRYGTMYYCFQQRKGTKNKIVVKRERN